MLQIKNTLISLDVIEKKFKCDLSKCKGACCLYGDSGAPLEEEEKQLIKKHFSKISSYLPKEHLKTLNKKGLFYKDKDGDWVTTLHEGKQCAFSFQENNIFFCAIEKAFLNKEIDFQKPISCHLYPVRIKKYSTFEAVNYDQWEICSPSLQKGEKENIHLFEFLKIPFERKYGKEWYEEFSIAANEYLAQQNK